MATIYSRAVLYPLVSADVALFCIEDNLLRVLLVRRVDEPEAGKWALPGAVLKPEGDADLEATARRALSNKVCVEIAHLEQVCTFSGHVRDPRGWSIAVLFYALLPRDRINAVVKSKVEAVEWVDAAKPGRRLAFDHGRQLALALEALRNKVRHHALPLHLMPARYTLTELQRTWEAVVGVSADKSAFRRRWKDSEHVVPIPGEFTAGAQRPAQLFRTRDGFVF